MKAWNHPFLLITFPVPGRHLNFDSCYLTLMGSPPLTSAHYSFLFLFSLFCAPDFVWHFVTCGSHVAALYVSVQGAAALHAKLRHDHSTGNGICGMWGFREVKFQVLVKLADLLRPIISVRSSCTPILGNQTHPRQDKTSFQWVIARKM